MYLLTYHFINICNLNQVLFQLSFFFFLFVVILTLVSIPTGLVVTGRSHLSPFRSSRSGVFCKKVILTISQNSQENTCARDLEKSLL